jgi:hypothetical protein
VYIIHKASVPTSDNTNSPAITGTEWLVLCTEIITVYCENHMRTGVEDDTRDFEEESTNRLEKTA